MATRFVRMSIWLVLVVLGFPLMVSEQAHAQMAGPQASSASPDTVVDESLMDWTIGGSMLYWGDHCPPGPDIAASGIEAIDATYLLRRMPLNGGFTRTLDSSIDPDCSNYQYMAADDSAIYYFNADEERIEKFSVTDPASGPLILASVSSHGPSTDLMIKEGNLYYGTSFREIMRLPVSGGVPQLVVSTSRIPNDIEFLGSRMYWTDSDGVWTVSLPCDGCARAQYSQKGGTYLVTTSSGAAVGSNVFWVVPGNETTIPNQIYTQVPAINGVKDQVFHSAPLGYGIGDPVSVKTGFLPGQTSMYWTESNSVEEDFVRRDGEIIAAVVGNLNHRTHVVNSDIYFARIDEGNQSILRIPRDADALKRDMMIDAIEVTQAVQNLENGVPLIANKDTYVRVYGRQLSGDLSGAAEAWLEGYRAGQPLPGSPLHSINGVQPLTTGEPIDRGPGRDATGDWLFRIPDSWDDEGLLELRAIVDPRGAYEDTDLANNTKTTSIPFTQEPDPCLVVYPIETHAPLPQYTDPILWETIDRLVSLWPVNGATVLWMGDPIRELELCWDWDGHCWGPYELDQGWEVTNFPPDSDRVIAKLMLRQAISQIQSINYCDASSTVHTVGMVHEDSNTGGTGGYANFLINASWVKFANTESSNNRKWNQPTAGMTLAQELTHNFWRYHIGCEEGEDSIFGLGDWPYEDRCKIDDRPLTAATTHYGFDPISLQIVQPDQAGDFMTYRNRRWVSDFTLNDVKLILRGLVAQLDVGVAAVEQTAPLEGDSLLLSGVYESDSKLGRFFYSYVLPDEMITDVATGGPPEEIDAAHVHHGPLETPDAHVRILGRAGELLVEHQLDLIAPDNHDANYAAYYFLNQIPKPNEAIGEIQLLVDGKMIHSVTPSNNSPIVDILSPAANDSLGKEITIRWRATDADKDVMLFSINYSRDGGISWLPLVTEYPGDVVGGVEQAVTSLTLESPDTLPGSDGNVALLRVIASDGFHTTVAEAGPFTVEDRVPSAIIQTPGEDEWFEPNRAIQLRGLGYDAEGGLMGDEVIEWSVDGEVLGNGRQRSILGLAPGVHSVKLEVTDSANQTATKDGVINILPLSVDTASSLRLDGRCNDSAYLSTTAVPVAPYESGGNASAYFVRLGDDLWVCLSGLTREAGVLSDVGLFVDADGSSDAAAQIDDYVFRLGEDGSPQVFAGNGSGEINSPAAIEFSGQVAATPTVWSAEFRIPATSLMLWNGPFGVAVSHRAGTDDRYWPYAAEDATPSSWAMVASEMVPYVDAIGPGSVTAGDQGVVLEVEGVRFGNQATLLWNGLAQTTVISDSTYLSVALDNSLLQSAGIIELAVVNTASSANASNPVKLVIHNRTPSITGLSPARAKLGAPATTVTISGQDFVDGSVVVWDGQPRTTHFISENRLEMDLTAADLSIEQAWGVTVLAPEPRHAASNTIDFVVGEPGPSSLPSGEKIYLPAVMR